jgi:hypothetical protein
VKAKSLKKLKPKMPQVVHIYSTIYYDSVVKPLVQACWERDKGTQTASGKPFTHVMSSALLTKEMWEASGTDVKEAVEKKHQIQHEVNLTKFESDCHNGEGPRTPQEYQV